MRFAILNVTKGGFMSFQRHDLAEPTAPSLFDSFREAKEAATLAAAIFSGHVIETVPIPTGTQFTAAGIGVDIGFLPSEVIGQLEADLIQ